MTGDFRTVAEQALLWRCSKGAVHAAITRGELAATLIAGKYLIDPADADAYEAERRNRRQVAKRTRRPRARARRAS